MAFAYAKEVAVQGRGEPPRRVSSALEFSLPPYVKKKENNLTTTTQRNLDHFEKIQKSLTYVKFNLIYFYTSSCQFKEQQQSNHLCLISSIHCRWSRE